MKCPQTKFHAHTMRGPKLLAQKRQNLSLGLISLAAYFFSLYWYFIETTTTAIDVLLQD